MKRTHHLAKNVFQGIKYIQAYNNNHTNDLASVRPSTAHEHDRLYLYMVNPLNLVRTSSLQWVWIPSTSRSEVKDNVRVQGNDIFCVALCLIWEFHWVTPGFGLSDTTFANTRVFSVLLLIGDWIEEGSVSTSGPSASQVNADQSVLRASKKRKVTTRRAFFLYFKSFFYADRISIKSK